MFSPHQQRGEPALPRGVRTPRTFLEHEIRENEIAVKHRKFVGGLEDVPQRRMKQRRPDADHAQQSPRHRPSRLPLEMLLRAPETIEGDERHRDGAEGVPRLSHPVEGRVVGLAPVDVRRASVSIHHQLRP